MITNQVSSAFSTGSSSTPSAVSSTTNGAGSERNMFLSLLVAQLKNQDPLAPQDGAQFVAQLAQFNSLDQLIGIRQSIEQLTTLMNQSQRS